MLNHAIIFRNQQCVGYEITFANNVPSKINIFFSGLGFNDEFVNTDVAVDIVGFFFYYDEGQFYLYGAAPVTEEAFDYYYGDNHLVNCP